MSSRNTKVDLLKYEHPKGSKIKISLRENITRGEAWGNSYRVYVPARYTGKSYAQTSFQTEEEAKAHAERIYEEHQVHGPIATELTTPQVCDAIDAIKHLKGLGVEQSLLEVVKYAGPRLKPKGGRVTVFDAINQMIKSRENMGYRKHGEKDVRNRLLTFADSFGNQFVPDLTKLEIMDWIQNLHKNNGESLAPRSRRNYYRRIVQFLNWCKGRDYIVTSPLDNVPREERRAIIGKADQNPAKIYTVQEVSKLLELTLTSANWKRLLPIWTLGFFCGLRRSELFKARFEDIRIDGEDAQIYVHPVGAKLRGERLTTIPPNALQWLSLCEDRTGAIYKYSGSTYDRDCKDLHRFANIERSDNSLRKSYGSYLYAYTMDDQLVAAEMGQPSSDTKTFHRHYKALVTKKDAELYRQITPPVSDSKIVRLVS
ncbi:MAG: site-specific integrase [Verrucomicrobia bacterium]|nr:site-specific integrase [Verrucomicrobiota bacterium]